MFKNHLQNSSSSANNKFLTVLYALGSHPLENWSHNVHNGSIRRCTDNDINSSCIELNGTNVIRCFIVCPPLNSKFNTLGNTEISKVFTVVYKLFCFCFPLMQV